MRTVRATRYVTPLREGGSLPGLVEADDDGLYVVKFRGAGQGPKALVAELVVGELARAGGLDVPELVLVDLDPRLGAAEPDPEIQELIGASAGLNVGLEFLPAAVTYNPAAGEDPDPALAAAIVWLDALATNVDRSPENPNLLRWHGRLWLIDHGAALYRQHGWAAADLQPERDALRPFPPIAEHVLLDCAGDIEAVDEQLAAAVLEALDDALAAVPEEWFEPHSRADYDAYLRARLQEPREFVAEAEWARRALRTGAP